MLNCVGCELSQISIFRLVIRRFLKPSRQKYDFGWLNDFGRLFFPEICVSCARSLNAGEDTICINCLINLPKTNYHRLVDNPVKRKFKGRIDLESASSFLYFNKGNSARVLLHHIKYHGRRDLGARLGALYGKDLVNDGYPVPDLIIPLPLHPAKERRRGYNQSTCIAEGLKKHLGCRLDHTSVRRVSDNSTQTRKGRYERWENVSSIFRVVSNENLRGKHVLLVDDVITTGATLEACGHTILRAGASRLSFLTLATA